MRPVRCASFRSCSIAVSIISSMRAITRSAASSWSRASRRRRRKGLLVLEEGVEQHTHALAGEGSDERRRHARDFANARSLVDDALHPCGAVFEHREHHGALVVEVLVQRAAPFWNSRGVGYWF